MIKQSVSSMHSVHDQDMVWNADPDLETVHRSSTLLVACNHLGM